MKYDNDVDVFLKYQLIQASNFVKAGGTANKRIAIILLDNFIEIQLRSQIKFHMFHDLMRPPEMKKYFEKRKGNILSYFNELLKASCEEHLISEEEKLLLNYCHGVRNEVYHNGAEDEILVDVSLFIYERVIVSRQPKWAFGCRLYSHSIDNEEMQRTLGVDCKDYNFSQSWDEFLESQFKYSNEIKLKPTHALYDFLNYKILATMSGWKFIQKNKNYLIEMYNCQGWDFDDFVRRFSFELRCESAINKIYETSGESARKKKVEKLFKEYSNKWSSMKLEIMNELEHNIMSIKDSSLEVALKKYFSFRERIELIHDAIIFACTEIDREMIYQFEKSIGK